MIVRMMGLILVCGMAGSAFGQWWSDNLYNFTTGAPNMVNQGTDTGGYAYSSVKPESGPWTAWHELRNHSAWANSDPIYVWSAQRINFNDWNISVGNAEADSFVVFRFDLSTDILSAVWEFATNRHCTGEGRLLAQYSTNGTDWITAADLTGDGIVSVTMHLNTGVTNVLYIGLLGNVPSGRVFYDPNNTGTLTFITPAAIEGTVSLPGFQGDKAGVGVRFDLTPTGGGSTVTRYVLLDADGNFRIEGVASGEYTLVAKAYASLSARTTVTVAEEGTSRVLETIVLTGDDINGDDVVSFEDFSILRNSYGQTGLAGANPLGAAAGGGCGGLGLLLLSLLGMALRYQD